MRVPPGWLFPPQLQLCSQTLPEVVSEPQATSSFPHGAAPGNFLAFYSLIPPQEYLVLLLNTKVPAIPTKPNTP